MFSKVFWLKASERALRTFAQSLIAFLGAKEVGILEVEWSVGFGLAATTAVISILMAIADPDTIVTGTAIKEYRPKHSKE